MTNPPNQGPNPWGNPSSQPSGQPYHQPSGDPYGAPAQQYGQQPGAQQYGQQPGAPQYGQQPYGQPPTQPGQGGGQPPYGGQPPAGGPEQPKKNNLPLLIGVGVVVLALVIGLIWAFTRGGDEVAATPTTATSTEPGTTEQETTEQETTEEETTEQETTEQETTEQETTEQETTEQETTEQETTEQQTTQNTGSAPADPGAYKSVAISSLTLPRAFGDYSLLDPESTSTILIFYTHNSNPGKLVSATVLPLGVDGSSSRARLVNPQVVGNAVCGTSSSGGSSSCVVDFSDGYMQMSAAEDLNATSALLQQWLDIATA
ncbi:hypothetical protein ACQB6S_13110 [Propionibacteriaceae bacterium Y1923]